MTKKPLCIPQDDLDCYYNKNWKNINALVSDKTSINNFTILQENIDNVLFNTIIDAEYSRNDTLNNLIKFRNSYFNKSDFDYSIINLINTIYHCNTVYELAITIQKLIRLNIPTFFNINVIPNYHHPDVYVLSIEEGEYMLDFENKENVNTYVDMLYQVYKFVNKKWKYKSNKKNFAINVLVIEKLFDNVSLEQEETEKLLEYNFCDDYQNFLKKYDTNNFWKTVLNYFMDNHKKIYYENKKFIIFIKNMIHNLTPKYIAMIKDYLVFCVFKKYSLYTSASNILSPVTNFIPSNKRIFIDLFYDKFGYYLQSVYDSNNINNNKFKQIREMFNQIKQYCLYVLENTNFFENITKQKAIQKIEKLDIILGSQKYSVDLSTITLTTDFYHNFQIIDSFYHNTMVSFVGKKISKKILSLNGEVYSFILNAYYDPSRNCIYIPTSITNDLFFKENEDPIYNYGGLGAIIGHEMMHSFDNYGSLFDENGHVTKWWSDNDYEKYQIELLKIKNHYSSLKINNIKLDSESSLSENIADVVGLKIAFRAFLFNHYPNVNFNRLTIKQKIYFQKFFKGWARVMRGVVDTNMLIFDLENDVHLPSVIRINAPFSHMNEYYKIFNVKPKNFNYIDPIFRSTFLDCI